MNLLRSLLCFAVCALPVIVLAQGPPGVATDAREAEIRALRVEVERISARLAALEAESHGTASSGVTGAEPGRPSAAAVPAGAPAAPTESASADASAASTEAATSSAPIVGGNEPSGAAVVRPGETAAMVAGVAKPAGVAAMVAGVAKPVETAPVLTPADKPALEFWRGTTLNFGVDGYYGYNFNAPVGRVNLLRAYDVSSNSFSLNQASVVVEKLVTAESRVGGRVDLQFGQATETLQGSSANEQRPQVWRNLYQAYGSWLAPVGSGLQLDFGKFASSLGNEGNYTKDQIAYSRGFLFDYLPFYHMGLGATYQVSPKVGAQYWLVNGANDTEDLNGYKSQAFLLTLAPASTVKWNVNYYFGEEARDVPTTLNPGLPVTGSQPGLPTANISPAPNGREHIFDTYATWQATPKLQLVGEADFVVNRTVAEQQPGRVAIGAVEGKYQLPRGWYVGWRGEYFDDRGGLFSGKTQSLKEATVVLNRDFGSGFQTKLEYRRDWSNQRYFLSDTVGALEGAQTTATVGLVYWWGMKEGAW